MRTWYPASRRFTVVRTSTFACSTAPGKQRKPSKLDRNENVTAWTKNEHLGFEVLYVFKGIVHKYRPDFIVRLKTGNYLVLETKGQDTDQNKTKREFLDEWVTAVNEHGGFGKWSWAVSRRPADVTGTIGRIANGTVGTGHNL